MKYIIFLCLGIVLLASNCKKEFPQEFYLECKVDGQRLLSDNCSNCETKQLIGDSSLLIGASTSSDSYGILVKKYPNMTIGTYRIGTVSDAANARYDNTPFISGDIFRTDSIRTGTITISLLDKTNKIIEGTFNFEAYNTVQNKVARITEGKFRLNYKTY